MPKKAKATKVWEPTSTEIGNRLREFAKQFGGISALERKQGLTKGYYAAYLRVSSPAMLGGNLLKSLAALGCNINWLLTGKNSPADSARVESISISSTAESAEAVIDVSAFKVVDENLVLLYPKTGENVIVVRKSTTKGKKK